MTKVLVVGPPRSGTTWVGQTLGRSRATRYVHEPDGDYEPYALKAKLGRAYQIELRPGDEAAHFEKLWQGAFAGGRRSSAPQARLSRRWYAATRLRDRIAARRGEPISLRLRGALALAAPLRGEPSEHVVAKSVHACLAVEWIEAEFTPSVVVVARHPLNVLSSWKQYGHGANPALCGELADYAKRQWDLELPVTTASRFERQVISLGVLLGALRETTARNPQWVVANHEDLCVEPERKFRDLAASVGLEFSEESARYLRESNQEGEGYATKRLAGALPSKWERELTENELREAAAVFDMFPFSLGLSAAMNERDRDG